nr:flagellinolysin [Sulfuriflexus mobilis]
MQIVSTNIASLNSQRNLNRSQSQLGVSLQRLSSGLRINSAKDDAAGLAISERMTTQIRGMKQARTNINDAISMMQTSEGALTEVSNLFQRGRELAVQAANATNSQTDRAAIQLEIDQLLSEVDRITSTADFNSVKLFGGGDTAVTYDPASTGLTPDQERVLESLKISWLEQSESLVSQYLGITASNVDLDIIFDTDTGAADAYVTTSGSTVELHLNTDTFLAVMNAQGDWPNQPLDNLIAHEVVHAVMVATTSLGTNPGAMPKWFSEGVAEFLPGGDLRLDNVLNSGASAADVIAELDNIQGSNWNTTDIQYAAAYTATRILHDEIIAGGQADGVKHLTQWLAADNTRTLNDYFSTVLQPAKGGDVNYADANAFIDNVVQAGGAAYIGGLTLNNLDDTGGIGGGEADGGGRDTSYTGSVPDIANLSNDPLAGFNESFPTGSRAILLSSTQTLQFQVGANVGETIDVSLVGINAGNLGVSDVDLTTNATQALGKFDVALDAINTERARLGATQNRLETAAASLETSIENNSAARSRIRDADFAEETAALTRSQILQQAGVAILQQANSLPQLALSLLQ